MTTSRRLCSPKMGFPISAILRASSSSALSCPSVPSCKRKEGAQSEIKWGKQSAKAKIHLALILKCDQVPVSLLMQGASCARASKNRLLKELSASKNWFRNDRNVPDENLLHCSKLILLQLTLHFFFLLLKDKGIERGSNINIYVLLRALRLCSSVFYFSPKKRLWESL